MFQEPDRAAFALEGGYDQTSSALHIAPGRMISVDNMEIVGNKPGYHRRGGYERCTNDILPSETSVVFVKVTGVSGTFSEGDDFECAATSVLVRPLEENTSPSDGDILPVATHSASSIESGDVFTDGSNIFSIDELVSGKEYYTATELKELASAAVELTRLNIPIVPGAGYVLGGFRLGGYNYAFRNDGLGNAKLYKGGDYSWSEIEMPEMLFFYGGTSEPDIGDVITDGTATATVVSVTRRAGYWNYEYDEEEQAAGYLTLSDITGDFTADNVVYKSYSSVPTIATADFASDSDWTKGTGWTIGSGVAAKAAGTASDLEQACALTSRTVRITFKVTAYVAGTVTPKLDTFKGDAVSAVGYYSQIITTSGATTTLAFEADATFDGSIDDVTIEDVGAVPSLLIGDFASDTIWTKGTGWAIAAGVATKTAGVGSTISQPFTLTSGRSIAITFTVSGYSAGGITPKLGDDEGASVSADGTYTQIITTTEDTDDISFEADLTFAGSIDDVSVAEAGFFKALSANYTYALKPDGRIDTRKHNFTNIADNDHIYGVSGTNDPFEFDGTNYIPIIHQDAAGYPTHLNIHQERLMLAFPGGEWAYSVAAEPRVFDAVDGAGVHSCGSEITGGFTVNGNTAVAFCQGSYWLLTGDGVYDDTTSARNWQFFKYDENVGGEEWTIAGMGDFYFLNNGELRSLTTTVSYGGFATKPIAGLIQPYLLDHSGEAVGALVCSDKSQYRVFFDDGTAAYVAFTGGKFKGATVVSFPDIPYSVWKAYESGKEYLFFGSSDGYLYRMDSGNTSDDDYIEGSFRLPFYHFGTPRITKRVPQVILEFDAPVLLSDDTTFTFTVNYSHGNVNTPRPLPETITDIDNAGGVYSDNAGFGQFAYGGAITSEIVAYLDGYGSNISLLVSYKTKHDSSFAFLNAIYDYIKLGREKR